jgi:hypothetical protein
MANGDDTGGEQRSSEEIRTALIERETGLKVVQYAVVDGLAIFEGDIILGTVEEVEQATAQVRAAGEVRAEADVTTEAVVITGNHRWANCQVPFKIDPALPNPQRVTDAIAHWQQHTNYRFIARTTEKDFVTFTSGNGCSSTVGRQGGQQFVNLGTGCSTGNAIHEIGHTIGLWHEQSRQDRDLFVRIQWQNVEAGKEHNFNQHITDGDDVGPYDYGSIMHYDRKAFSKNGQDTIVPATPASIGQRTTLSAGDIAAANSLCAPAQQVRKPPRRHAVAHHLGGGDADPGNEGDATG